MRDDIEGIPIYYLFFRPGGKPQYTDYSMSYCVAREPLDSYMTHTT